VRHRSVSAFLESDDDDDNEAESELGAPAPKPKKAVAAAAAGTAAAATTTQAAALANSGCEDGRPAVARRRLPWLHALVEHIGDDTGAAPVLALLLRSSEAVVKQLVNDELFDRFHGLVRLRAMKRATFGIIGRLGKGLGRKGILLRVLRRCYKQSG